MIDTKSKHDIKQMKQKKLSKKIGTLDRELLQMIEKRIELSMRLAKLDIKKLSLDEVSIKKLLNRCSSLIKKEFVVGAFENIINETKRLNSENTKLVGFQGEHGAYGDVASRMIIPKSAYMPCLEFVDVFDGVSEGIFDLGVVPVENSLEGAVTQVNDLLTKTNLKVIGEVKVPIHHCLLAKPGMDLNSIKIVYSHPQALAQCRNFLLENKLEARPFYDTAGAAKMIDQERPLATAAIASSLSAKLYGLDIIKEGIEDVDSNTTRFQLISKNPYNGAGNKCSIIFAVTHEAGALQKVLQSFADSSINLTRIASTPHKSDPGNYTFFCDFEGCDQDKKIKDVLAHIEEYTKELTVLGCYPKWEK